MEKARTRSVMQLATGLLASLTLFAGTAVAAGHGKDKAAQKDIVDTAIAAGSFNTLVAAVKAADLVDALQGDGPLTVFAPTDEAFSKLPKGTIENLLKPENKEQLRSILLYHVVAGNILSKDVTDGATPSTLQGSNLSVSVNDGVAINDARVVTVDIGASNGVIHVIDSVLLHQRRVNPSLNGRWEGRSQDRPFFWGIMVQ